MIGGLLWRFTMNAVYIPAPSPNPPSLRTQVALSRATEFERELAQAMRANHRAHRSIAAIQSDLDSAIAEAIRYDF